MHSSPGNWVATEHAFVYYGLAVHAFSAGIVCRNCKPNWLTFRFKNFVVLINYFA